MDKEVRRAMLSLDHDVCLQQLNQITGIIQIQELMMEIGEQLKTQGQLLRRDLFGHE